MVLPLAAKGAFPDWKKEVRLGVIADLHQDIMHDAAERLGVFLSTMKKAGVDALFQLGDFAVPSEKNRTVVEQFKSAHKRTYHVLGNHDTDSGHTVAQCLNQWGMPAPYYRAAVDGLQVLVLNGNVKARRRTKEGMQPMSATSNGPGWLSSWQQDPGRF